MTDRKKKGIGFAISGAVFLGVGGVMFFMESTPEFVPTIIQVVGLIAGFFGFKTVFPDTED